MFLQVQFDAQTYAITRVLEDVKVAAKTCYEAYLDEPVTGYMHAVR